jgi:hypothetical protein
MNPNVIRSTLGALALCLLAGASHAAVPGTVAQECGSCHLAFPADMLPAESWKRIMNPLPQHFGTDASVDATTRAAIEKTLVAGAASFGRAATPPPEDRITRGNWFVREHREVSASVWSRPAIKSAANCAACHTRADQGDFNEHAIRIPR